MRDGLAASKGIAMKWGMRTEWQLLLCCARTAPDAPCSERIRALCRSGIDWDQLIVLADHHRVMPLLYHTLHALPPGDVPSATLARLEQAYFGNTARNVALKVALLDVLQEFAAHAIPAIPFKGPVLASLAYGGLSLRAAGDLDILVRREDAIRAKNLLIARGFQPQYTLSDDQEFERSHHFLLVRERDAIPVEIHWRLSEACFGFGLDEDAVWRNPAQFRLAGVDLTVLPSAELLLFLCAHGAKHYWERLSWICDIAELVQMERGIDWERLLHQARAIGAARRLAVGLLLARDLLGATLPDAVLDRIEADPSAGSLVREVRARILGPVPAPPQYSERLSFYLRAMEHLRDKIQCCRSAAISPVGLDRTALPLRCRLTLLLATAVMPNERDRALLPLPLSLAFLYYFVRPLRLAATCPWSAARRYGRLCEVMGVKRRGGSDFARARIETG
jgi:hypothetical protein